MDIQSGAPPIIELGDSAEPPPILLETNSHTYPHHHHHAGTNQTNPKQNGRTRQREQSTLRSPKAIQTEDRSKALDTVRESWSQITTQKGKKNKSEPPLMDLRSTPAEKSGGGGGGRAGQGRDTLGAAEAVWGGAPAA